MIFDELDQKMRVFETAADFSVLPGVYMLARLDGRGFTRLTKEVCRFEAPFDARFRDLMVATTESLMSCGFHVTYGYTQSDEISLVFAQDEQQFGRKLRKYTSILAGQASAEFSLQLGRVATFDCRISQLPNLELVVDYFRWRSEDAARNALNAHCYWMLRNQGLTNQDATTALSSLSNSQKHELLMSHRLNFNELPAWQKRGTGLYWEQFDKVAVNPLTGGDVAVRRRRLSVDGELPTRQAYSDWLGQRLLVPRTKAARR
jgi:tRNA(His) guanylyltransferase